MPIKLRDVSLEVKLLPLELLEDGTCKVAIRTGYVDDGVFTVTDYRVVVVSAEDTATILNAPPVAGLSRRDDLAYAVYTWLVAAGHIEAGVIS